MGNLDLALIGNCSFAALIDPKARICWTCLPRFDGDPVFHSLLGGGDEAETGFYDVRIEDFERAEQRYVDNTAVVETVLHDRHGNSVAILDFAPRYIHYRRSYRPTTIVRVLRPRSGSPRIRVLLRPRFGWGAIEPQVTRGSNHVRWVSPEMVLRLTTDVPIAYLREEIPFVLEEPRTLLLGPDEPLRDAVGEEGERLLRLTLDYWRDFSRYLALPFEWQDAVIRAAITLKLCTFEETGAVIAAVTTSIPEAPDTQRNWDYRFCWLRDAWFVINALNRLGATRTMEDYLDYIINIVSAAPDGYLQPVYGIALERRLHERVVDTLPGYRGMGPVRAGNDAWRQVQNDSYGAVVLAVAQTFFDHRLQHRGDERLFARLERLGEQAVRRYAEPDAGLWEFRGMARPHTFSAAMCWAACDRLARIAAGLGLGERGRYWAGHARRIHGEVLERAWNPGLGSFVSSLDGDDVDASLLLLQTLGFVAADDPRFHGTIAAVERRLKRGDLLFRYAETDDFGIPETAFTICTFWYIEALAAVGRRDEARSLFERMLARRNPLGLLSEDVDPSSGSLWGNFPQTYSMVGLIHAAMRLSTSWEEAF
ncbi:glycoside hydrolase family 15 protein [Arenibaculum sp.]|uniref:glycoside hydrolase family 15 protein n=1 Tax=Arenibaculum sp. TaxID=2865862 RepID=UPI002E103775|nr:glycoside hydrolase family 15 protein [Arenibaculum sp.]